MSHASSESSPKNTQYLKGGSSKWVNQQNASPKVSHWQDGYAAFTVSRSQIPTVQKYIGTQRQHHTRHSFQEEIRAMLLKHKVMFDERYLWG